jgi:hypothetical protein
MRKRAERIADASSRNEKTTLAMSRNIAAAIAIVAFFATALARPSSVLARLDGLIVYGDMDERSREESLSTGRVLWFAKGTHNGFLNVGTERYRQVAVELK